MVNKKAQGLPLNLIVLAAVAALVLVLVVAFTVGGTGSFFGKIFRSGTAAAGNEQDVAITACNSLCDQAKSIAGTNLWTSTGVCTRTFSFDRDGDGKIGGGACTSTGRHAGDLVGAKYCGATSTGKTMRESNINCADLGVACTVDIVTPAKTVTCTLPAKAACAATNCA